MTIGELEAALDMPRANIRFYEQEGFIHPRRGANNYRDYTEEDADTLRKVKLLRQLGLSLEEIRQAQRGERPLAALLGEQEAALARRRAELDWAGQVCRAMREDGVEFATLDAHRYLSRLDRPADQPGFFDLRADAAPTVSHPWRRYFARGLDYSLCSFLWMVVCLFLFRWFPENNWGVRLLNAYAAYGILLAAEPLLLCTWGYTPGKWIFGAGGPKPGRGKAHLGPGPVPHLGGVCQGRGVRHPYLRSLAQLQVLASVQGRRTGGLGGGHLLYHEGRERPAHRGLCRRPGRPVWPEPAPGTSGDPDAPPPGASHSGGIRRQRQRLVPEAGCVLRRADERGG